jgi:hypothetical protein
MHQLADNLRAGKLLDRAVAEKPTQPRAQSWPVSSPPRAVSRKR